MNGSAVITRGLDAELRVSKINNHKIIKEAIHGFTT